MFTPAISVRYAKARVDERREDVVLLDIREDWELEVARVDPHVHIPMNQLSQRLAELNPAHEILVFCRTGRRSAEVTDYLIKQGFRNAKNVAGGIHAWADEFDTHLVKY